MDDVGVFKASHDVDDSVSLSDVGEKFVSQTRSLMSPLYNPTTKDKQSQ
jgi:hypothetical protein